MNKSRKLVSTVLAVLMVFGLFAAMPLTANALNSVVNVTENPASAGYVAGEAIVPIRATFHYEPIKGENILPRVQWYVSQEYSTEDRSNGLGSNLVSFDSNGNFTATLIPEADVIGEKYYFAVLDYTVTSTGLTAAIQWESKEAVTNPCRVEIRDLDNQVREYSVVFVENGGTPVPTRPYTYGELVDTPFATKKEGYIFSGWYSDAALTLAYDFNTPVTSNLVLYAKWTPGQYTVTFVTNGGSAIPSKTYNGGELVEKPSDPTRTAYTFAGWYEDAAFTWHTMYYFNVPITANLTLYAKWTPIRSLHIYNFSVIRQFKANLFTDVDENAWYGYNQQKVIASAYEYGLMQGSGSTFNPTGNMTIAEAITIAARVHTIYSGGTGEFTQGNPWYQVYVDYAIEKEIINAGTFSDYNKAATRAEMAYIFSHALPEAEFSSQNTVNVLPDVTSGTPYYSAIIMLYKAGVLTGSDDRGTFNPNANITRAEAAAIISRVILPDTRVNNRTYG